MYIQDSNAQSSQRCLPRAQLSSFAEQPGSKGLRSQNQFIGSSHLHLLAASSRPQSYIPRCSGRLEVSAFSKVLIANRGEIAVRVIRACKELGLQTVAVYSVADRDCLHVQVSVPCHLPCCLPAGTVLSNTNACLMQLADEAVCIGEGPSSESYLNIPNLLAAAVSRGVDALHPVRALLAGNLVWAMKYLQCD